MGGSDVNQEAAVYGTLGTPAVGNIPGSRYLTATWADHSGNLWLFGGGQGGLGDNEYLFNDLWVFNPATNEWAWVGGANSANQPGVYGTQGKAASGNLPGARDGAASWTDSAGHFWLFGGVGYDAVGNEGLLNDLWELDPSTMEWNWVSGSSTVGASEGQTGVYGTLGIPAADNTPGGRESPVGWVDNGGHVWLFGGYGFDANGFGNGLNDLWEFNPSTTEWVWMGGNNTGCVYGAQSGVWGTMGTPAAGNIPSCRYGASGWTDSSGNFWLFGGEGRDIDGYWGDLNNVWEFNSSTKEWAWMGGTNIIDLPVGVPPGSYGTVGVPAAGNIPAGRSNAATWTDAGGNLWLMGGLATGFEGDSGWSILNDLWEFKAAANEWSWIGGSSSSIEGGIGVYGTLGVAGAANVPGARWGGAGWTDGNGNLWLFGGEGYPNSLLDCDLSDLWKYAPLAPAPVPGFAVVDLNDPAFYNTQSFTVQAGTSGTTTINTVVADGFDGTIALSAVGLPSGITASFSPDSITGFGSSQVTFSVGLGVTPGNYTITVAGTSQGVTETASVPLTVGPAPPPTFTLSVSPTALTVSSGSQGTVTLTLTPEFGFNSTISFACSNLPDEATCSFNPATVTPSGAAATTQLTISVSSQSSAAMPNFRPFPPLTALAAALCLCGCGWRRRRWLQFLLLAVAFAGLSVVSACGGGGSAPPPVTTTVTISATGGLYLKTTTISLTVN
jgi:N-acetylneuraminic acid mutarotase